MRRSFTFLAPVAALLVIGTAASAVSAQSGFYVVTVNDNQDYGETAPRSVGPIHVAGGVGSSAVGSGRIELGRLLSFGSCSNPVSGLFTPQVDSRTIDSVDLFDIRCPGCPESPSQPTPVVLHTTLTGRLEISGAHPYGASITLQVMSGSDFLLGSIALDANGLQTSGFLTGAPVVLDHYPVDIPLSLYLGRDGGDFLSLVLDSSVGGTAFGTEINTALADFGGDGWQLASGPVFSGLAEGTTIDIPGLNVVHNVWLGPATTGVASATPGALALAPQHNPVRDVARLSLTLPESGLARVDVFDVSGARIATLADGWRPAGTQSLEWTTGAAPTGVYFARATLGARGTTARIVIVR